MENRTESNQIVRFGDFALDLRSGELRTNGHHNILQEKPFQILTALLERPGEMISREELTERLWPTGTFVDFNLGLNKAVNRLREALDDNAENPIFIETIPRRGYRFIAPVQHAPVQEEVRPRLEPVSSGNGDRLPSAIEPRTASPILTPAAAKPRWTSIWVIGLGIVFLGICGSLYRLTFPPQLRVTQLTRLTSSGHSDPWGRLASDGSRLFFLEREGDHWNDRQVSVAGGESMPFGPSGRNIRIHTVSPDRSEILFAPFIARLPDLPLWSMPLIGGSTRRVGEILANGAVFSPDGTRIAFTNSAGQFVANRDGSGVRQLAAIPDSWDIAWSPDSKILRFNGHGPRLWQVTPAGQDLHPFLPAWTAWEGRWTFDGSYYIFTATKEGRTGLWAVAESAPFPWLKPSPVQLTFPPLTIAGGLPSRDGQTIYALGGLSEQIDVVNYDPATHQFKPVMPGFNVKELAYSPDHQWVLYNDWKQLWRSRPDGSDRLILGGPPALPGIHFARWSPDSKHILFNNLVGDDTEIYLVSVEGGPPQPLLPPTLPGRGPAWSPDGQTISFTILQDGGETSASKPGVYLFDLAQRRSTWIPASEGLAGSAWSPNGRFLAAQSADDSMMKVFDLGAHRWTVVAHGTAISFPVWSPDSVLYFQDLLEPGQPVYRVPPGVSGPQRVYSFEDILQGSSALRCGFQGFAPDGSLLVQVSRGGGDVYAVSVSPR
jgi:DNA-binding winged helix-turn-helix (wHTH) protein/Tol biopolymer transport system component